MTENTAVSKPGTTAAKKSTATRRTTAKRPATGRSTATKAVAKPAATADITDKLAKPSKKHKKEKKADGKSKVIRDSFTMPKDEYAKLGEFKQLCLKAGLHVKKSELLRAGLIELGKLSIPQLERAIVQLAPIKTGRPKKD